MQTFLTAKWQNLIMANYEIDPSLLQPYLPKGVHLDYFNGKTYISLVGFLFKNTALFGLPMPLIGTFEEVNLRFYVVRKIGNEIKRGVVFINETVPNQLVAWVANKLYKEHYKAVETAHRWTLTEENKEIEYLWKVNHKWNSLSVNASTSAIKMQAGTMQSFIFEHYYGYTKLDQSQSIEYKINHPSWEVNMVNQFDIKCDFGLFYGSDFEGLTDIKPHSVFLAEGSAISVDWKRIRF